VVLTINDDRKVDKIEEAAAMVGTSLPVLHDKGSAIVNAYRAYALPSLFLLDKEHKIVKVWTGSMKDKTDELREYISSALESDGEPPVGE